MKRFNKHFIHVITILFINFLLIACEKKEDNNYVNVPIPTPQYTDFGANTFSFKVNGKQVIAKDVLERMHGVDAIYYQTNDTVNGSTMYVEGYFSDTNYYEAVKFRIADFKDTGMYVVKNCCWPGQAHTIGYFIGFTENTALEYFTNSVNYGYIHVMKLDTFNQIISGKFRFVGQLEFLGVYMDSLTITEGLFDTRYSK